MATLLFTKMQATGNDFVMVDNRDKEIGSDRFGELARRVSDRKFGIGSDGLIVLEETAVKELAMHYKNPDGSDAGMCGNGGRCFVRFARRLGYEGDIRFKVHDRSYHGVPGDEDETVTLHFPLETSVEPVEAGGETFFQVYTNTEHIVCPVEPAVLSNKAALVKKGRTLRHHKTFAPLGTNVNFMSGRTESELQFQTFERGVEDLTLACGTGAIASAIAWHHHSGSRPGSFSMDALAEGGKLKVHFTFDSSSETYNKIRLEGPVATVFEGIFFY